MANLPALVFDLSIGQQRQITTSDNLYVGAGIDRQSAGALSVGGTTATSLALGSSGITTTVAGALSQTTGQVTLNGNVDATNGLDVTTAALTAAAGLTITGGAVTMGTSVTDINLDPTGTFDLAMASTKVATIHLSDNLAAAFLIEDSNGDDYFKVDSSTGSEKLSFGNTGNNPTFEFYGSGGLSVGGDVVVAGNFTVQGDTFISEAETVLYDDNHLYLNNAYETVSAQTAGLVGNYLPTATNDTVAATGFVAGVPATSNPTVKTAGSGTFAAGDLVQIAGANSAENNGLFEVLTHTTTTLTIAGIGTSAATQDWVQNQFATDTVVAGTIRKINVSVIRAGTDGVWEVGKGSSTTGFTFDDLATAAGATLTSAYVAGNTLTTDSGNGDFIVAGTETMDVNIAADFSANVTNSAGQHLFSGGNLQLNDSINLTLGTGDDLTLVHNGTNSIITSAVGDLIIDNTLATGSTLLDLGTDTAATDVQIRKNTGTPLFTVTGAGQATFSGNVDATNGLDVTTAALTAAAGITNSGGQVLISGGNVQLNDSIVLSFGTGDDLSISHGGTNTTFTSITGDLIFDNQLVTGSTIFDLGTDTSATDFLIRNNTGTPYLTVTGAGLVDVSDGTLDVPAGTSFLINGAAVGTALFTAANLSKMFDGSDVGSLHTHTGLDADSVVSGSWDTDTNSVAVNDVAAYTTTANRADLADATAASGTQTLIGISKVVHASTGEIVTGGRYPTARFAASLTLANGERVFVSKTAGALTNTVAAFTTGDKIIPVGRIRDKLTYNGTDDFLADVELDFGEIVTVA